MWKCQETKPSVFLWWIAGSSRCETVQAVVTVISDAFPSTNKVLVFTALETQTILGGNKIGAFFNQAVELESPILGGLDPEDAFGHGRFPVSETRSYTPSLRYNPFIGWC